MRRRSARYTLRRSKCLFKSINLPILATISAFSLALHAVEPDPILLLKSQIKFSDIRSGDFLVTYAAATEKSDPYTHITRGMSHISMAVPAFPGLTSKRQEEKSSKRRLCHIEAPRWFASCSWQPGRYLVLRSKAGQSVADFGVRTFQRGFSYDSTLGLSPAATNSSNKSIIPAFYCSSFAIHVLEANLPIKIQGRSLKELWALRSSRPDLATKADEMQDRHLFVRRLELSFKISSLQSENLAKLLEHLDSDSLGAKKNIILPFDIYEYATKASTSRGQDLSYVGWVAI